MYSTTGANSRKEKKSNIIHQSRRYSSENGSLFTKEIDRLLLRIHGWSQTDDGYEDEGYEDLFLDWKEEHRLNETIKKKGKKQQLLQ